MPHRRPSSHPRNAEFRRRALGRLLTSVARATEALPIRQRFSRRVFDAINYQGGVRALLHEYARNGCRPADRELLKRLVQSRSRRRPGAPQAPYWTETRLHRELRPYLEAYLEAAGRYEVIAAITADQRWALLAAIKRAGGIRRLFERWEIKEELAPFIQRRLDEWIALSFPAHAERQLFPTSREVYRQDVALHVFIGDRAGGYRAAAASIGFQTIKDRRCLAARVALIEGLGALILERGGLPRKEHLPTSLWNMRRSRKTIERYLQDLARDREVQEAIDAVQARLKAALKNGVPPKKKKGLILAHRLFRRIVERCERS